MKLRTVGQDKELTAMKFVPVEKRSKRAQREYYKQKRGCAIPPSRVGKTVHEYKKRKQELKEREY